MREEPEYAAHRADVSASSAESAVVATSETRSPTRDTGSNPVLPTT